MVRSGEKGECIVIAGLHARLEPIVLPGPPASGVASGYSKYLVNTLHFPEKRNNLNNVGITFLSLGSKQICKDDAEDRKTTSC